VTLQVVFPSGKSYIITSGDVAPQGLTLPQLPALALHAINRLAHEVWNTAAESGYETLQWQHFRKRFRDPDAGESV
jgi:hypothetical protein